MRHLPAESKESAIPATPGLMSQPGTSKQQQDFNPQPSFKSQGTSSKLDELLHKQAINFKAFKRTVTSIDVEKICTKWKFEDALHQLNSRWSVIDSLHWEIDSILDGEDVDYENSFTRHESIFNNLKEAINTKLWSVSHRENITPKVDIPIFNGNYQQWVSFKNLFNEAVHLNPSLSNAQKMQYLKSKIKGEAERLIQHLSISSQNYTSCWEILNHRYENKKLIFTSHINVILGLPNTQQQSLTQIKNMHDATKECLNAIKNLGVDTSTWDPMIVHILALKLDTDTHNDYIESLKNPRELPTLQEFLSFLEMKFTALESSKRKQEPPKTFQHPQKPTPAAYPKAFQKSHLFKSFASNHNNSSQNGKGINYTTQNCPICNNNHAIIYCNKFAESQPKLQLQTITRLQLCQNCLYNHNGNKCFSTKRCRVCNENHHTLVHEAFAQRTSQNTASTASLEKQPKNSSNVSLDDTQEILLATAQVSVQAADGSSLVMRALIDQGSQTSLITENAAQRLGLPRQHCKGVILGLGAKENTCKGFMNIKISSQYSDYSLNTGVFIMNHAVNNLPNKSFNKPAWSFINDIQLADPEFYRRRPVDLLLGADVYSSIIMEGIIKQSESIPVAQQTRLGWILCGNVKSFQCNVVMVDVDSLQKFWSIEDINENIDISQEDYQCIQQYKSTTTRQSDGKYVVRLPLHPDADEKLGLSKTKACAQFYQLERKLQKDDNLFNKYKSFINEYKELGHMHLTIARNMKPAYYMPHHGVHRADSSTTSLRVVFNASEKTSTGVSLNDVMYRGPNLQQDILLLILNWRQYPYAFIADIEKMFRQILISKQDQRYQQIVWRENPNQPLKEYTLSTVTYGTKAAPFLAMMTLKQLAKDECNRYPIAARVLEEQFYMDDLLSGAFDIISAKQLQRDLIDLLKSGGFNLHKWSANESSLLEDVDKAENLASDTYDLKHQQQLTYNTKLEAKKILSNVVTKNNNISANFISDFIDKYSSFTYASRVLAWILRISSSVTKQHYLTTQELQNSQLKIIKAIQYLEFSQEINDLNSLSRVDSKSKLLCLNPFLDEQGLLRVGGRLKNSNISYNMKHPYIIPQSSHLTNLLLI
ncbi:uncharacterized protein LOC123696250 [Colias croceus]|uniref:uncharacterized protein LOC123696250 n=1 Tax=Colias crocea TaxID=72248 RepID=UPI001E27FAD5|nr:uncharacterized protein LOC123696250 [Colias croceus]